MRFWDLALMMVLVNVFGAALSSSGALNKMGLSAEITAYNPTQDDITTMEEDLKSSVSGDITGYDSTDTVFGIITKAIVQSFNKVFDPLKKYILWPAMLM